MNRTIDHQSKVPLHKQAETIVRNQINDASYANGKLLPNETELCKQLGISRQTLRQSINTLVQEGILTRKKGVGTWVQNTPVSSKSTNWLSFSQEMSARGITIKNFELHVSWVLPEEEVRLFFQLDRNIKVLKLIRLRGEQSHPFVYFVSYFNPDIGLTGNEDFKLPLYEILVTKFNVKAQLSREEISARLADKVLGDKLEIKIGSPILFRKRFVYDKNEKPIEFNLGYYRADSFKFTLESNRT